MSELETLGWQAAATMNGLNKRVAELQAENERLKVAIHDDNRQITRLQSLHVEMLGMLKTLTNALMVGGIDEAAKEAVALVKKVEARI